MEAKAEIKYDTTGWVRTFDDGEVPAKVDACGGLSNSGRGGSG